VRSIIAIALLLIGCLPAPSGVTAQTMRSTAAGITSRKSTGAPRAMMIFVAQRGWQIDAGFDRAVMLREETGSLFGLKQHKG